MGEGQIPRSGPLGTCGHANHVDGERGEPSEAGKVLDRLLVAGDHTSALFDAVQEAFNLFAISVTDLAIDSSRRAIPARLDPCFRFEGFQTLSDLVMLHSPHNGDQSQVAVRNLFVQRFKDRLQAFTAELPKQCLDPCLHRGGDPR